MNTLKIVHLLDDFALGGVTNALRVFENAPITDFAHSRTEQVDPHAVCARPFEADVIMVHFPPRWRGMAFLLTLRILNPAARIIHVEHSYSREWEALHVPDKRRFRVLLKMAFRLADDVVSVSQSQAQWLREIRAVPSRKLKVIYPYSRGQGLGDVPPLEFKANEQLVVGSFGRFADAKGFDRLINAFTSMDAADNMRLVLGGVGPKESELRQLAKGCERIEFVGEVKDTAAFMRSIHVFAIPSRFETFGLVATEAREAGRPLLVSNAGGLIEQVGKAGLIVNCDNADELLWSLRALPALPLTAMARAGRAAAQRCVVARAEAWVALLSKQKQPFYANRSGRSRRFLAGTAAIPR